MGILLVSALALLVSAEAATESASPLLKFPPPDVTSVTEYYDQPVYDSAQQKIGTIVDLLIDKDGLIQAAIISVGGFLGLPSKYVGTPFTALQMSPKDRRPQIVLDVDRRTLREARGFRYNRAARRWEREEED